MNSSILYGGRWPLSGLFGRSAIGKRGGKATTSPYSETNIAAVVYKIEHSSHVAIKPAEPYVTTISSPTHEEIEDTEATAQSHDSIQSLAVTLIDPNLLWENFFSRVIDHFADPIVECSMEEDKEEFTHSRNAVKRGEHFPIKLILTPLRRGRGVANSLLEMQFGPLHAALQVGNVVLEWNDTSLVAPHLCAYEDQVMELDMQPHNQWVKYTGQQHSTIRKAAENEKMDFPEQTELLYKVSSEKTRLIHALIKVVIGYNKYYYYNVFSRNCQHFVRDALEALEVDLLSELPGALGALGALREYYNALIKGKTPSVPSEFKTHADLDEYVMRLRAIANMPQHDLEFLLVLYFRFHLESKSALKRGDGKALKEWQCQEKACCMEKIEKLIKIESMKIHNFRTIILS